MRNEVTVEGGTSPLKVSLLAARAAPLAPAPFGGVEALLAGAGEAGSTEDLAFGPDGKLVLGVPGRLVLVGADGSAAFQAVTGHQLESPLGIAYDAAGNLWAADAAGKALRRISPTFEVSTVATGDGAQDFKGPNFVAIGPGGKVYLTDPCIKELMRIDPATGAVEDVLAFDGATEGGPNGIAFTADGKKAYVATENTALLCMDGAAPLDAQIAGLFAVEITDGGFGGKTAVAEDLGLFGDGVTIDAEGNVYAIFDLKKEGELALGESAVFVFPGGEGPPARLASATDVVLANLEFGAPPFDETTLYIALLAVPAFGFNARGVVTAQVGIKGQPLFK